MLLEQVRKTIEEYNLIENKQHIVLGLSGGPDSVCLFHILMRLGEQMDIRIHPVHLNHKFRPVAAEKDQEYVQKLCERMGVRCRVFTKDCSAMAKELSMTSEEAGRKARYDAFYKTAADIARELEAQGMPPERAMDSVRIAVAQNANDQAETVLFRLLRGTGTDGLAGISHKREERGFKVIRPLLDIYRAQIEEYCHRHRLEPVTDHTNNEMLYARNKIRLELIPFMEKGYNENIKEALVRLSRIAAEDKEYIWQQTEKQYDALLLSSETAESKHWKDGAVECEQGVSDAVVMDRERLSNTPPAIRHRLIMKAFAQIGLEKDISEERIKSADSVISKKQAPKTVEFPHGYRLKVAKGRVIFFKS